MFDNRDFDGWAESYDSDVRESAQRYPFAGYEELMGRIAARMIKKRRGAPVSVLDLGCGTGVLASRLAEAGCAVTGVDFSAEMLAEAARRCPSL
ncbi:MAG TPA: methyltransferase domain-containing protein, partial [Candidatus Scatomorpha stercorigallinarum]|nr:methyltransferase domain-containing protein [Candidatus Scatomorpha stercorigallinarum]